MKVGLESLRARIVPRRAQRSRRRRAAFGVAMVFFTFLLASLPGRTAGLKPDEHVILYPALARPVQGGWDIEARGLVYEPERRRLTVGLLRRLLGFDEENLTSADAARFRERIGYFLVDDERAKEIAVGVGASSVRLGLSAANGHFFGRWHWATNEALIGAWLRAVSNGVVTLELPLEGAQGRSRSMQIHLVAEKGISIISDIDDTIKISNVRDRDTLLKNTLYRPFQPVSGMADCYRDWQQGGQTNDVQFHYVTASPWQLYLPLAEFIRSNGFPAGTFHMKNFRLKDSSAFSLLASPERYKLEVLEPLLRQFPRRSFVLVGDSGEADPEIYGELARRHPQQVRRIFIRNVTPQDGEPARYRAAFHDVPGAVWKVFADPVELSGTLDALSVER